MQNTTLQRKRVLMSLTSFLNSNELNTTFALLFLQLPLYINTLM